MTYTILNAKIVDPQSKWNKKKVDLLIVDGKIKKIGKGIKPKGEVIEGTALSISPGWIDMKVNFRDPGLEFKEDLKTGLAAAKCGGFTSVVSMPSTSPVVDNKSSVEYLINKSKGSGVKIYPAASISKNLEGKELSEMVDLSNSGVRLFSDDKHAIADSSLMSRALLYSKNTRATLCSHPQDPNVSGAGKMNEGPVSTRLGLTGIPNMAETIILKRDIDLLRYTESRLHVSGVTTAEGVKLIREAKREGLEISAEVHMANLLWTDERLTEYDTNYKLDPPLRSEKDRKALIKGVNDGTIDCISSDHRPEDVEHKKIEFGQANYGIALIESFYPLYNTMLSDSISLETFVNALTYKPCAILGLKSITIEEGSPAVVTLFSEKGKPSVSPNFTKAYNTPCIHEKVRGTVIATMR